MVGGAGSGTDASVDGISGGGGRCVGGNPSGLYWVDASLYSFLLLWGDCVKASTGDCEVADVDLGFGRVELPLLTWARNRGDCAEDDWRLEA